MVDNSNIHQDRERVTMETKINLFDIKPARAHKQLITNISKEQK